MKAARWDKNVWVLNASSEEARVKLLISNFIELEGSMVRLFSDHPFFALDKDGNRIPSTKLIIDGIPIEMDGDIVCKFLASIGINQRSKLQYENAWDPETRTITDWLTGKRFIYIDLPQKELKKSHKIGKHDIKLYYKEMEKETPRCKRCFGTHWTNMCTEEEKCIVCKLPGHRRGDPTCPKVIEEFGDTAEQNKDLQTNENDENVNNDLSPELNEKQYLSEDDGGDDRDEYVDEDDESEAEDREEDDDDSKEDTKKKEAETEGSSDIGKMADAKTDVPKQAKQIDPKCVKGGNKLPAASGKNKKMTNAELKG